MTQPAAAPAFDLTPHARKREPGQCTHVAPCGNKCCQDAKPKHVFHSCSRIECQQCHGAERFQGKVAR